MRRHHGAVLGWKACDAKSAAACFEAAIWLLCVVVTSSGVGYQLGIVCSSCSFLAIMRPSGRTTVRVYRVSGDEMSGDRLPRDCCRWFHSVRCGGELCRYPSDASASLRLVCVCPVENFRHLSFRRTARIRVLLLPPCVSPRLQGWPARPACLRLPGRIPAG